MELTDPSGPHTDEEDMPADEPDSDDATSELPRSAAARRAAATRIYDGSITIGWRIRRWVIWPWEQDHDFWPRLGSTLGRAAWVVALLVGAVRLAALHPQLWYFYIGGWILSSVRQRPEERAPDDPDQDPEEAPTEPAPAPRQASPEEVRAWIVPKIRALIGDSNGIHLEALLDRLVREGHLPAGTRITIFRRELEANGIPVRDDVNVARSTRVGIHRDDLITVAGGAAAGLLTPPPPDPDSPGRAV